MKINFLKIQENIAKLQKCIFIFGLAVMIYFCDAWILTMLWPRGIENAYGDAIGLLFVMFAIIPACVIFLIIFAVSMICLIAYFLLGYFYSKISFKEILYNVVYNSKLFLNSIRTKPIFFSIIIIHLVVFAAFVLYTIFSSLFPL